MAVYRTAVSPLYFTDEQTETIKPALTCRGSPYSTIISNIQTDPYQTVTSLTYVFVPLDFRPQNLFVPAMDTLRAVIFRARQLFLCCPVNGGLTYRLPSAKFVHSGNFGGCGLVPPLYCYRWLGLVCYRSGREALQDETVVWKYIKIATIVRYCVT